MLPTKRFGAVFTALLGIAALTAVALHSTARGAKPSPNIIRPISYLTATSSFDIAVIDDKGTSSVTVNRNASGSYPRWSPDGLQIGGYYKWLGNDHAIMTMSPSGANEQVVLTRGEFLAWNLMRGGVLDSSGFEFSSSNCWLGTDAIIFTGSTTYEGETVPDYQLFIVDASGVITPLTESAPDGVRVTDPHWSAALDKVVFATAGDTNPELYAINPDGTGPQQITDFAGSVSDLRWAAWSPAGDRVLVTVRPGPQSNWQLWILDVISISRIPVWAREDGSPPWTRSRSRTAGVATYRQRRGHRTEGELFSRAPCMTGVTADSSNW